MTTINPEREQRLLVEKNANLNQNLPPWHEVIIESRDELQWIIEDSGWSTDIIRDPALQRSNRGNGDLDAPEGRSRPYLRGINLQTLNLSGINLTGADLSFARLEFVDLSHSHLPGIILYKARLNSASLQGAYLHWADFRDADIRSADLQEAELNGSLFDATTRVGGIKLDESSCFVDVVWNDVLLTGISWEHMAQIGDEKKIKKDKNRTKRSEATAKALRAYEGISIALRSQGLGREAAKFRLRRQRLERKFLLRQGRIGEWFLSRVSDLFAGYGELTVKPFISYLVTILIFAALYYFLSNALSTNSFSPIGALVFSVTSFHGRGFFPGNALGLDNPITILAAFEAIVGLFIEIILVATFSKRFLENR